MHQQSSLEDLLVLRGDALGPLFVQYGTPAGLIGKDGYITAWGWGVLAAVVSAIYCFITYKSSRIITPLFSRTYRELPTVERRNWDSRYSSNIHSLLCVYFAYELLWKSDFFWRDGPVPMYIRTSPATNVAMGVSFGYFAVDFVTCVKYTMGGMEMVLHHMGSLLAVTTALVTGNGHMHTIWMLVTEFTTPLINNRWWLEKIGWKEHPLYVINGLSILFTWIFARLAVFPPFFWIVWKTKDQIKYILPLSQFLMIAVPIILAILNVYWFTKIVRGAIKVLFGAKKKTKTA